MIDSSYYIVDEELFLRIADGDENAFTDFFNRYYPVLKPFVAKFYSDPDVAEDVLQETFIRVWLNRDKLPELKNLQSWLFTIVSRICLNSMRNDLLRRKKSEESGRHHNIKPITPDQTIHLSEIDRLVYQAINKMPPSRQLIYRMSREQGLKPAKIAEELSISVSTVKNTLVTALKEIRGFLTENGHFLSLVFLLKRHL